MSEETRKHYGAEIPIGRSGGMMVYTAIPDRWCFKCQRERPAIFCSICLNETKPIAEIDPRDVKPRSRLGRIIDRFKFARMQRRR